MQGGGEVQAGPSGTATPASREGLTTFLAAEASRRPRPLPFVSWWEFLCGDRILGEGNAYSKRGWHGVHQ
eukprot:5229213-Prymnesium_polylepis.1